MNQRRSRARFASSLACVALLAVSIPAAAQDTSDLPPPLPPAPADPAAPGGAPAPAPAARTGTHSARPAPEAYEESESDEPSDAPKARKGFQLALRTGAALPLGKADKGTNQADVFGPQVPLIVDIGGKVIPNLFVGGYLGLAFGGAGGDAAKKCDDSGISCTGVGLRIGVQAQYHILPQGKVNPWVGYGIGYEAAGFSGEKAGNKFTLTRAGVEFAHLMAGVDFRVSRVFGIGPFADFAIGKYTVGSDEITVGGVSHKVNGDVPDPTIHQWLTLGAKVTFFP